ncbi:hypothetical protein BHE74_00034256 [Ensete ventricosum]|nr:hypothetical protein BHE74_00034256 [Ensete ventricosum]
MVAIKCKRRWRVAEGGSNDGGVSVGSDQWWLRLLQPKVSCHWARKATIGAIEEQGCSSKGRSDWGTEMVARRKQHAGSNSDDVAVCDQGLGLRQRRAQLRGLQVADRGGDSSDEG